MSTKVIVPLSEYLDTSYHPDCEYVDGQLLERNVANGTTPAYKCC